MKKHVAANFKRFPQSFTRKFPHKVKVFSKSALFSLDFENKLSFSHIHTEITHFSQKRAKNFIINFQTDIQNFYFPFTFKSKNFTISHDTKETKWKLQKKKNWKWKIVDGPFQIDFHQSMSCEISIQNYPLPSKLHKFHIEKHPITQKRPKMRKKREKLFKKYENRETPCSFISTKKIFLLKNVVICYCWTWFRNNR